MNVFILRHGKAEERGTKPDEERHLTEEGIESLRKSMPGMRELTGQIDFALTSPLPRAAQTAGIVGEYFRCNSFIEVTPLLAQSGAEKEILKKLNGLIGKENVVVVGHEPNLTELIAFMTGDSKDAATELKKGGLAKVKFKGFIEPGGGRLEWVKKPRELKGE